MTHNNHAQMLVIAIIAATTLAFIQPDLVTTYRFYRINNDALPASQPTVNQVQANGAQFHTSSTNITIAQAFAATTGNDGCNVDVNHLCAAKLRDIDGTLTVIEYVSGDYHSLFL